MNLIPAKYVVDVQLTAGHCLNLSCGSLNAVLDAIVSQVCSSEIPVLDFKCLSTSDTDQQFYQSLIDKLCDLETQITALGVDEFTWSPCVSDGWTCGDDPCVTVTKPCGITETRDEVIQALSERIVAQGTQINDLCTRLTLLEATVAGLETQVAAISNCC